MPFNKIAFFLKLVRWQNLLIIAISQYLMRYCVIDPMMSTLGKSAGMEFLLQVSSLNFSLLVLSTVLIAAAGNVINDYFDLKIDRVNKPHKIIVGKFIKRRVAIVLHIVLNSLGVIIGAYVAYSIGMWKLGLIHAFAVMSLWYYSTHFKHYVFTGNFIIALLAANVPLIVGLYEIPLLNYRYGLFLSEFKVGFNFISYWIIAYALFAFLFTLAREITKDIADIEGDEHYGSRTLPIAYGITVSRYIILFIYAIAISLMVFAWIKYLHDNTTLVYMAVFIGIPLLITMYKTVTAKEKKQFLSAGDWNKITSVSGILYALLARHIILQGPLF